MFVRSVSCRCSRLIGRSPFRTRTNSSPRRRVHTDSLPGTMTSRQSQSLLGQSHSRLALPRSAPRSSAEKLPHKGRVEMAARGFKIPRFQDRFNGGLLLALPESRHLKDGEAAIWMGFPQGIRRPTELRKSPPHGRAHYRRKQGAEHTG